MNLSLDLSKGQQLDLSKTAPSLTRAVLGAGWDLAELDVYGRKQEFDLDISALLLENGRITRVEDIVWYKNLNVSGVSHTGDNRTGIGEGDDEAIKLNLPAVESRINRIVFVVTIHEAFSRNQNFGQVKNAFVRLYDENTQHEVLRFSLTDNYSTETALIVCSLDRNPNGWTFNAIGEGVVGDLNTVLSKF